MVSGDISEDGEDVWKFKGHVNDKEMVLFGSYRFK